MRRSCDIKVERGSMLPSRADVKPYRRLQFCPQPKRCSRVCEDMRMKVSRLTGLFIYVAIAASAVTLVLGLNEARLQLDENQYLGQVAQQLRSGRAADDLQAAVNFVFGTCRRGDGKRGMLRSSTLDILEPKIGGQCGEYTRAAINLLNQMGYTARRVYLFPQPEPGQVFDPRTPPSYHVLAEVWVDERWVAIDPLRGLVFHDEHGNLASLAEVANNPAVIEQAYQDRPVLEYLTVWDIPVREQLDITAGYYQHAQRLNWGTIAKVPGAYQAARLVFGERTRDLALPLFLEQPHTILASVFLSISGSLAAMVGGLGLRRIVHVQVGTPIRNPAALIHTSD
jgi:hypothetical protein